MVTVKFTPKRKGSEIDASEWKVIKIDPSVITDFVE